MTAQRTIDRTDWPPGPWDDEPDRLEWTDEATGLPCLIRRTRAGFLCGYVGVGEDHPFYGLDMSAVRDRDDCPDVHRGVTWGDRRPDNLPGDLWWIGFDCGHDGDESPARPTHGWGIYANIYYVRGQVEILARQVAEVTP